MDIPSYYASSNRVKKLVKEGRGQGMLEKYTPWMTTYDFSSKGRVTRTTGIKTGRIHQLQSDLQYRAFLIFEFSNSVIDIRESYPLLDVMETIDYTGIRFDKFQNKETGEPYVITTNFLLTVKDNDHKEKFVARTVKNRSELKRKITWERLEIERRYWNEKGVSWKVITNNELSRPLAKNIEWIRETLKNDKTIHFDKDEFSIYLLEAINENIDIPIRNLLNNFDKSEGLNKGTGLYLFRYLIAKKEIRLDLSKSVNLSLNPQQLLL